MSGWVWLLVWVLSSVALCSALAWLVHKNKEAGR